MKFGLNKYGTLRCGKGHAWVPEQSLNMNFKSVKQYDMVEASSFCNNFIVNNFNRILIRFCKKTTTNNNCVQLKHIYN